MDVCSPGRESMNRDHLERQQSAPSTDPRRRKTLQLCRQAEHALYYALLELDDPELEPLDLEEVRPDANGSRLCAVLRYIARTEEVADDALDRARERLDAAGPALRAAVASAIHRRRAPELSFLVLPADGEEAGDA